MSTNKMNVVRANGTQLHKMAAASLHLMVLRFKSCSKNKIIKLNKPPQKRTSLSAPSIPMLLRRGVFFTITFFTPVIDRPDGFPQQRDAPIGRTEMAEEAG